MRLENGRCAGVRNALLDCPHRLPGSFLPPLGSAIARTTFNLTSHPKSGTKGAR